MSTSTRYPLSDADRKQLEITLSHRPPDSAERRHACAILLLNGGTSPAAVAAHLKTTPRTVYQWLRRWREEGFKGLSDRTPRKRQPFSDDRYIATLVEILMQTPLRYRMSADRWSVALLRENMHSITGTMLGDRQMRRLLHRLGYRYKYAPPKPSMVSNPPIRRKWFARWHIPEKDHS